MKGKVLFVLPNGEKLIFRDISFYKDNEYIIRFPLSRVLSFFSKSRIISRFLRLEPRSIGQLSNTKYVICALHKIWLLDIENYSLEVLVKNDVRWSNPLNFCNDGKFLYWGDYGNNPSRLPVNVYRLDEYLKVSVVYQFPAGLIRHIHNVLWDKKHQRFFVFTGDLENTSGIYLASSDWKTVEAVKVGSQQYRAVIAFLCNDGLIYATDSVVNENHIYKLKNGEIEYICKIPGSCIYGTETKEFYVFSTTVEPSEGRGFLSMFSYKLGAGILDRYSHVLTVRKRDLYIQEIYKTKKDWLPMKLFQYGSIMFPQGQEGSEELLGYIMGCKGDGHTIQLF